MEAEQIRAKAWQLGREFLQGAWREVEPEALLIRHISGGLTNLVFSVGLPKNVRPRGREPAVTLLRLFGEEHITPEQQYKLINETVVFTMLAERNLGPKLHGVFHGGRFEEFIVGHTPTPQEIRGVKCSREIAKNLALVHSMDVPVSKDPTWLGETLRSYLSKIGPIRLECIDYEERESAAMVATFNLREEVDWVLRFLYNVESPVVFSHNDVNTGNILVREDSTSWDPVVFIDFEFAAYNYRAFDIANHFNEWTYDYDRKDFPYYHRQREKYPSLSEQKQWIRHYLRTYREQQQMEKENNQNETEGSDDKENSQSDTDDTLWLFSEEHLLREVSAFTVACHLLWALWSVKQANTSNIPFAYYNYAADRLEEYKQHKENLQGECPPKRRRPRHGSSQGDFIN